VRLALGRVAALDEHAVDLPLPLMKEVFAVSTPAEGAAQEGMSEGE
jgi:hypothetical protein